LSESEAESNEEPKPDLFSSQRKANPQPRRPKSGEEEQRATERQATRRREREASRPFHQFVYQLSEECKRIQDKLGAGEASVPAHISALAYENVKDLWAKRGIWDTRWGMLPGMSWKHEHPLEEVRDGDSVPAQANPPERDSRGAERVASLFELYASAGSNQQASGATARINPPGLGRSRGVRSAARQERGPSKRNGPFQGWTESIDHWQKTRLGLSARQRCPSPTEQGDIAPERGQNESAEVPSDNAPPLPGPELHEAGTGIVAVPQRKSQRLQNKTGGVGEIVSTGLPQNLPQAKQRRAPVGALKPEASGVSRKQHLNTRRRSSNGR